MFHDITTTKQHKTNRGHISWNIFSSHIELSRVVTLVYSCSRFVRIRDVYMLLCSYLVNFSWRFRRPSKAWISNCTKQFSVKWNYLSMPLLQRWITVKIRHGWGVTYHTCYVNMITYPCLIQLIPDSRRDPSFPHIRLRNGVSIFVNRP